MAAETATRNPVSGVTCDKVFILKLVTALAGSIRRGRQQIRESAAVSIMTGPTAPIQQRLMPGSFTETVFVVTGKATCLNRLIEQEIIFGIVRLMAMRTFFPGQRPMQEFWFKFFQLIFELLMTTEAELRLRRLQIDPADHAVRSMTFPALAVSYRLVDFTGRKFVNELRMTVETPLPGLTRLRLITGDKKRKSHNQRDNFSCRDHLSSPCTREG
jgi:hypothetical protein